MKNVKEIKPKGFYVFEGRSSANSSMFESLTEAKEFLTSANKRLHNYLNIHEYLFTQDSWTMLCEIESEEKIKQTYLKAREESKRDHLQPAYDQVWQIISEQMRHMLSRFVKYCNFHQKRTGSKVHSSYKRYWFETYEEALAFIEGMRNQRYRKSQDRRKYRANSSHFGIGKKERMGHVYLCSKNLRSNENSGNIGAGSIIGEVLKTNVLRQMIKTTINLHSTPKSQNLHPKIE